MEILSEVVKTVTIGHEWGFSGWAIVGTAIAGLGIVMVIVGILMASEPGDVSALAFVVVLMGVVWIGFGVATWASKPITKEITEYKIVLNDDYSYNQLVDEYDVMDQEGKILTIREKGWDSLD